MEQLLFLDENVDGWLDSLVVFIIHSTIDCSLLR